ncbi:hypothetical protein C8J57DRAFT_1584068 [Mycena rebaudengoi]|nr:hypothetical protein C8J57DRAFT_1584068 [Mycena rebaudengoi]
MLDLLFCSSASFLELCHCQSFARVLFALYAGYWPIWPSEAGTASRDTRDFPHVIPIYMAYIMCLNLIVRTAIAWAVGAQRIGFHAPIKCSTSAFALKDYSHVVSRGRNSGSNNIASAGSITTHHPRYNPHQTSPIRPSAPRAAPLPSSSAQAKGSSRLESLGGSSNVPCILCTSHTAHIYFTFFEAHFTFIVIDNVKDYLTAVFQIRTIVLVVVHSGDTEIKDLMVAAQIETSSSLMYQNSPLISGVYHGHTAN